MNSSSMRISRYGDQPKSQVGLSSFYYSGTSPRAQRNSGVNFKQMDVTVSVLGLTGIMVEDKGRKKSIPKIGKRLKNASASVSSSSYSTDDDDQGGPVKAVVTFFKSVNRETAIASHLPSLPLRPHASGENSFIATWPTDFDPMGNELSTFKFSRMMQIEEETRHKYRTSNLPLFVPERVQLTIGLTRGTEMITIGTTTLVVTGDEAQDVQVNLPLRLIEFNNTKLTSKKKLGKAIKPAGFSKDSHRKYNLHPNSCLKVLVRASPSQRAKPNFSIDQNVSDMMMLGSQSLSSSEVRASPSQRVKQNFSIDQNVSDMMMLGSQSLSSSEVRASPSQRAKPNFSVDHNVPDIMMLGSQSLSSSEEMHSYPSIPQQRVPMEAVYKTSHPGPYSHGMNGTFHDRQEIYPHGYVYERNFPDCIEEETDDNSQSSTVDNTIDDYTADYTDDFTGDDTNDYSADETTLTRDKKQTFQFSSLFDTCAGNMCMYNPAPTMSSVTKYRELSKQMFQTSLFSQTSSEEGFDQEKTYYSKERYRSRKPRRKQKKTTHQDDFSVATEKIKNVGGQGYGLSINDSEDDGELDNARQEIKRYASRNGVNPTMMI